MTRYPLRLIGLVTASLTIGIALWAGLLVVAVALWRAFAGG